MTNYIKYAVIYKTSLVRNPPIKIISDQVVFEVFRGKRSFDTPRQVSSILPEKEDSLIAKNSPLTLEEGQTYIQITARTKEVDPFLAKSVCENEVDMVLAMVSIVINSDIFAELVYRGWILNENRAILESWVRVSKAISIENSFLSEQLATARKKHRQNNDLFERFKLMSRFYAKACPLKPSEEKFLLLWTIVEIFPMKDTSNIEALIIFLAKLTGKSVMETKEKLAIGKLYGTRCDLVHNGKLNIELKTMWETFERLEQIIITVLREMNGINYNGSLDKYLN
ncbi:MAG: hypothetical protein KKC80_03980 [Candidatus Margulisbacteria bacterium]|nr:hypothetical protein [Candidatus Margulisiibacteriota bacterium]MBU1616718.1 hypothetical protein [Candidatus Margulisiibacteriota bacterium]